MSIELGVVVDFDEHIGLGHVQPSDDTAPLLFHCTQISDGSRVIAVGTAVHYIVRPRPKGPEAYTVTPVA